MSRKDATDECPIVPELARHFRAKNKSGIVTCLAQLKSDPKHRKEFAQRSSGLDILVQLLRCKSDTIMNMSLSVLADACMAYDVREKVKDTKIGINVVLIIKNLQLDTKLHCRACRLISNLSESSWHVKELCDAGVVKALVPLLILKTSTQTYCMAIRAMRNIWSFYVHIRETMVELQIIKMITQLFVMAEEKSYEDAKHAELVDACLKAMCAFLVTLDPRCGAQMQVDKDKQGYKCLMRCCNKSNNKMAMKCLYILCQIAECRLQLGISGTIEEVIAWVNSVENSSTEQMYEEILISLCLFCRESVNRNRIKNSDGLQLIIVLLNNSKHERYHSMLLQALVQFVYDDNALDILTKHGIMDVLVAKLKDAIAKDMELVKLKDDKNNSKKRFSDSPSEYLSKHLKCNRTYANRTRFSMDFYRDDWSPRSVTSASSSSPPSTPPLPPCSDSNAETDDTEDDDIYSPICSDTEWGDNDEEDEEVASLKSYKSLTTAETDFDSPATSSETSGKINACEFYTIQLLNKLSFSEPIDELADPKIIIPLTTYIKYTRKQNIHKYRYIAIKILKRIMNNTAYFLPLLKQGLVFDLQTLPEAEDCTRRLRMVAETGGAIGQLSFILLRGEDEYKLLTAVSIPLLIKTHRHLKCLLDKYGGLELIFRLLRESSHELHERAIWSICQLARTLKIHSSDHSITVASMKTSDYSRLSLDETTSHTKPTVSSTVTFELDDGTTVEACKRMLCRRSDFFSVMLEGNFSESGKRRVRLKNTSRDGLNTLILAANGTSFEYENIESLLDATLLADKFLMSDLADALTESSVAKLNHENLCQAWCWGRNYSCHEWRSYCVKSFLTAKLSWSETMQTFRDFYATDAFDEFLHEVRDIIEYVLCQ
ncbi:LOW QUALITY PROTEIN: armadillo repeat-containing protein 5 [Nylanderia fulva]|uniref:LOW QUALITY PROTEIN: armadillo repeat-containing protein 5 n=1 Tax=Nylanderia fulva TaxID=613905 RepID=UPI0010FBB2C6|nr:LOW QUALITY PROTEIN: armadillo repeat-containing protein 5 [Nylanderia fulva]